MRQFEKIKAMNVDELKIFITLIAKGSEPWCNNLGELSDYSNCEDCDFCVKKWLESEVEK